MAGCACEPCNTLWRLVDTNLRLKCLFMPRAFIRVLAPTDIRCVACGHRVVVRVCAPADLVAARMARLGEWTPDEPCV